MARKKRNRRSVTAPKVVVVEQKPFQEFANYSHRDTWALFAVGALLTVILLATIWWNRFLPMQDYPQHLFMAVVANTYEDSSFEWQETFELRNQFGPYRGTHLALRGLSYLTGPETSGKILASVYVMLVALVAYKIDRAGEGRFPHWGALLAFPFCFHPMYFYGFINYFISIPIMFLALLDLQPFMAGPASRRSIVRQFAFQALLFFLHPYTLLVFVVLALATVGLLGRDRGGRLRGLAATTVAGLLFVGALVYEAAVTPGRPLEPAIGEHYALWPIAWNLKFLALQFTGMRVMRDANWYVCGLWVGALVLLVCTAWWRRQQYRSRLWFPVMFLLALVGYLVLPFSIQTDGTYTFFNVRMAPIVFFLAVPIAASIPMGRVASPLFAGICLVLTCYSANLHHRVAKEIASFAPILDRIDKNAVVLPLTGESPSDYLDPFYYNNFHQCFPFYYHIVKGGVTPDMFDRRLMPVGYRDGKKPGRPPVWAPYAWAEFGNQYDYVLAQKVSGPARQLLERYCQFLGFEGPWTLYKIRQ